MVAVQATSYDALVRDAARHVLAPLVSTTSTTNGDVSQSPVQPPDELQVAIDFALSNNATQSELKRSFGSTADSNHNTATATSAGVALVSG